MLLYANSAIVRVDLLVVVVTPKVLLYDSINPLGLAVSLGVETGGGLLLDVGENSKSLGEY